MRLEAEGVILLKLRNVTLFEEADDWDKPLSKLRKPHDLQLKLKLKLKASSNQHALVSRQTPDAK